MAYGIKETKEVLKFGVELGEAVDRALSDDKMDIADLVQLVPAFTAAGAAFENISLVPKELADMDEAESKELLEWAKAELDLSNDNVEAIVEKALETVLCMYEMYQLVKGDPGEEEDNNPAPAE